MRTLRLLALMLAAGAALPMIFVIASGQPAPDDVYWDLLMTMGFICAGGIALLPLVTARGTVRLEQSAPIARAGFELHELLSYVFVAGVFLHAIGLIIYQPVTIEYLKLSAPAYMLAGIVSAMVLLVLIVQSKRSRRRYAHFTTWRRIHVLLSWSAIVLMAWHVVGSGYYVVSSTGSSVLFGALLAPGVGALLRKRHTRTKAGAGVSGASRGTAVRSISTGALLATVAVFWLVIAVAFAVLRI